MTVAKDVLNRIHVQRLLLAVALLGVSLTASAASSFPAFMAKVSGRSTTIGAASDGTLIVTKGSGLTAGGGWTNAGNYGVAAGAAGAVKIGGSGTVMAGGKAVPVEIGGSLTKDVIAGAVAGCLSGTIAGCAIGVATPLAIAWMGLSGARFNPDTKQLERSDPSACTVGPCFEWYAAQAGAPQSTKSRKPATACDNMATWYNSLGLNDQMRDVSTGGTASAPNCSFTFYRGSVPQRGVTIDLDGIQAPVQSATWYPTTPAEVRDALILQGAPAPMMVPELEKAGVDWNKRWPGYDTGTADGTMANPKVTGPASIKGERVVTTNPDGSTTTKETETPIMYQGSKVTAGDTTTTEKKTKVDGTPGEETKTVTEPGDEPSKPEEPAKDPCEGHPVRLGCIDIDVPEGEIPKTTKNVTFEAEDPLGGGACPANVTASFSTLGGQSATIVDWQTFCGQALPLRALVMGLAAIMAFFIIMPGGVRE